MTTWNKKAFNPTNYKKQSEGAYLTTNNNVPITTNDNRFLVVLGKTWVKIVNLITSWTKI